MRVPLIMSWPGHLAPGSTSHDPVITLDLMATFTAAAGSPAKTEDSVNLLPFLTGEKTGEPHDYLYWRSGPTLAIRDSRWKLIHYKRTDLRQDDVISEADDRIQAPPGGWPMDAPLGLVTLLYDLANDPGETTNVAAAHPDVVARLDARLDAWRKDLVPPVPVADPLHRHPVRRRVGAVPLLIALPLPIAGADLARRACRLRPFAAAGERRGSRRRGPASADSRSSRGRSIPQARRRTRGRAARRPSSRRESRCGPKRRDGPAPDWRTAAGRWRHSRRRGRTPPRPGCADRRARARRRRRTAGNHASRSAIARRTQQPR